MSDQQEATAAVEDEDAIEPDFIWAEVDYEEGTSGPVKKIQGIWVDSEDGVAITNPDTGSITVIGDRMIVRIVLWPMFQDDPEDGETSDTSEDQDNSSEEE